MVLAVAGGAAVVVGCHDAALAADVTARVTGSLLALLGLVPLAGAVAIVRRSRVGYPLGIVSCALSAFVALLIAASQVIARNVNWHLIIPLLLAVGAAAGGVYLWHSVPPAYRAPRFRQFPIIGTLLPLGVIVSLVQFWYTTIYQPSTAPASLTISISFSKPTVGATAQRVFIPGSVTIKNSGGSRVNTVGSIYFASGYRLAATVVGADKFDDAIAEAIVTPGVSARRYATQRNPVVVEQGRLLLDGTFLEAGQQTTVPFTLSAPPGRFDVISMIAWVGVGRATLRVTDEQSTAPYTEGSKIIYETPVVDRSWVRRITRGKRWLRAIYDTTPNSPNGLEIHVTRHEGRNDSRGYEAATARYYGLSFDFSQAAVLLTQKASRKAR
jgi:hypothetical protein